MNKVPYHRNLYLGFVLHGNKVWLSELLSLLFVSILVLALTGIGGVIIFNTGRIDRIDSRISHLRYENRVIEKELRDFNARYTLAASLKSLMGNRISDTSMAQLIELVYDNSRRYGYDPLLVLAVIHIESVFDPRALGRYRDGTHSGALGLMQLKFATAQEVARNLDLKLECKEDLMKPELNMALGIGYLARLITQFNDFKLGLLAYNQGPGTIIQTLSSKRPLSISYYNKVLRTYYRLREAAKENRRENRRPEN